MNHTENIKKYQDLYKRYKDLVGKTTIRAYEVVSGEKISVNNISIKDLKDKESVENQLKEGLIF